MKEERFIPAKRQALDGKTWWVVYDNKRKEYSTYVCHGRYKRKKDCVFYIDYYNSLYSDLF